MPAITLGDSKTVQREKRHTGKERSAKKEEIDMFYLETEKESACVEYTKEEENIWRKIV